MRKKVIIDTDPGVDDGMAIQLALCSPELEIVGITSVFGNVSVDITTINALRLLDIADRNDIKVSKGAAKPLRRDFRGGVPHIHGEDGQGNTRQPPSKITAIAEIAHHFMAKKIHEFPQEVTLLTLGPLTNVALLLCEYPEIYSQIKEIVIMGGNAFCSGNATPAAEANILSDPEAADLVFGADWKITLVGLDVTQRVVMSSDLLKTISKQGSALNKYVCSTYPFYLDFYRKVNKIEGVFVHDPTAVACLIAKDLFTIKSYPIRVETKDGISFGKTWPSTGDSDHEEDDLLTPWVNRPRIDICVDVDAGKVLKFIEERLS